MNTRVFREVEYLSGIDVMIQLKKDFMSDRHIFPDLRDLHNTCSIIIVKQKTFIL